jgi:phage shock protein C
VGEKRKERPNATPPGRESMKKLYRSETDRKIAGVCGGIGEFLDIDSTIVRLIAIVVTFATGIIPFLIGYLVAWWIVPTAGDVKRR